MVLEYVGCYWILESCIYVELGLIEKIIFDKVDDIGVDLIVVGSYMCSGLVLLFGFIVCGLVFGVYCDVFVVKMDKCKKESLQVGLG